MTRSSSRASSARMKRIAADPPRVLVTGLGYLAAPFLQQALEGQRIAPPEAAPELTGFEVPEGAPALGFEIADFKIESYLPNITTYVDRASALAMAAAKLALDDTGLLDKDQRPIGTEIGCAYGTTMGCLEAMEIFWKKCKSTNPKFAPPLPFTHSYANSPSSLLCIEFGLRSAAATFSGERTAGVEAVLFAMDQIMLGSTEIVLVCASEALHRALHAHLFSEGRLSGEGKLAAWGEDNDGVVPGEGAACLVLESDKSAARRGAKVYAEVAGVGLGSGSAVNPYLEAWDRAGEEVIRAVDVSGAPVLIVAATPEEPSVDQWEGPFWAKRLAKAAAAAAMAPKLYSGELMSVSPILGCALAARVLKGELRGAGLPDACGLGEAPASPGPFGTAFVGAIDPLASAGIVALKQAK